MSKSNDLERQQSLDDQPPAASLAPSLASSLDNDAADEKELDEKFLVKFEPDDPRNPMVRLSLACSPDARLNLVFLPRQNWSRQRRWVM